MFNMIDSFLRARQSYQIALTDDSLGSAQASMVNPGNRHGAS
jgi:hypothetical protein